MDKDSFVFHKSFLDGLPEEDISMWCQHIVQYGLFGKEPEFGNPYMTTVWIKIKNFMDSNTTKWEKKKEANRQWYENKKNRKSSENSENSDFSDNSATLPYTPSVSVSEYVNEYVNESVSVSVNEYESEREVDTSCPAPSKKGFLKPSPEDVKSYVSEKGYTFDPGAFYNFYESNGWKVGKNSMKDWKAACKTWQQREKDHPTKPKLDTVDPSRTEGWEVDSW